jgi:hypothetical protein
LKDYRGFSFELSLLTSFERSLVNQRLGVFESLKQGEVPRSLAAIGVVESRAPARTVLPFDLSQRYLNPLVVNGDERAHGSYCIAAHSANVEKCKQLNGTTSTAVTDPGLKSLGLAPKCAIGLLCGPSFGVDFRVRQMM